MNYLSDHLDATVMKGVEKSLKPRVDQTVRIQVSAVTSQGVSATVSVFGNVTVHNEVQQGVWVVRNGPRMQRGRR